MVRWLVVWLVGIYRVPAEDLVGEYASAIGLVIAGEAYMVIYLYGLVGALV